MERPGKVVAEGAAVVILRHRDETSHAQEEEHEEVKGQGSSHGSCQEWSVSRHANHAYLGSERTKQVFQSLKPMYNDGMQEQIPRKVTGSM